MNNSIHRLDIIIIVLCLRVHFKGGGFNDWPYVYSGTVSFRAWYPSICIDIIWTEIKEKGTVG